MYLCILLLYKFQPSCAVPVGSLRLLEVLRASADVPEGTRHRPKLAQELCRNPLLSKSISQIFFAQPQKMDRTLVVPPRISLQCGLNVMPWI